MHHSAFPVNAGISAALSGETAEPRETRSGSGRIPIRVAVEIQTAAVATTSN